ncbi:MAG TPA: Smr/MutS family protein [Gemmatimonadaceae bacterium]|nr:Smr/MutS family protein [Gemmatimonadaceae bacterium]
MHHAFDELRFPRDRILNLRIRLPTAAEAVARTEAWLRERQVEHAGEVLIITGRGNQSVGGVPVVREAVRKLLSSLRRRGVVAAARDHTPGSFIVELAPVAALRSAPRRKREPASVLADPKALAMLHADTRALLRRLAALSLAELGVRDPERFMEREMLEQFSLFAMALPNGTDREARLRDALQAAIDEYDDG